MHPEYDHLMESARESEPITYEPTPLGWSAYPSSGWEPGEPLGHGPTKEVALTDLREQQEQLR